MKKLNLAVIGQGRSGRGIHGAYYLSEANTLYNVKYVVDRDADRRALAAEAFPNAEILADYTELFLKSDIDLVVNSTFSEMHYPVTKDLLLHGFNVLVEKPFARSRYECLDLIKTAEEKGVVLAVFQQSFLAHYYLFTKDLIASGKLGEIKEASIRFSNLSRRWDWQTILRKCAGGLYNTGPHPIGIALGLLGFSENVRVAYSKLDTALTSGDGDDFAKVILTDGKLTVDVEVSNIDAYSDYNIKLQGTKGTFKTTTGAYKMTYIVDGENLERPLMEETLKTAEGKPIYCREELIKHTEEGVFDGTPFNSAVAELYRQLYLRITEGTPMDVTAEMAAEIIGVIEEVHAENRLPLKF